MTRQQPVSQRLADLIEELRRELQGGFGSCYAFYIVANGQVVAGSSASLGTVRPVVGTHDPDTTIKLED